MKNKQFILVTIILFLIMLFAAIWTSFVTILTWVNNDLPDIAAVGFEDLHRQSLSINDQLQRLATATDPNMTAEDKNAFRDSVIANPPDSINRQYQSIVAKMTVRWFSIVAVTTLIGISLLIIKNAVLKQSLFSRQLSQVILIWGIFMLVLSIVLPLIEGIIDCILTGIFSLTINFMLFFCGLAVIWFSQLFQHATTIQEELDMVI
ncbi:MAG: hypothetical protein PUG90_00070 [Clostridia bacterium]|nr:hypothetical protein [Clostridia bacterium]MDY4083098.1 hypothetical protein [Eubacteriales bacterium]